MSNGEHGRTCELLLDDFLDSFLCDDINVGGGLIEDDKLVAFKDGPDDADKLALADGQVLALLLHLEEETLAIFFVLLLLLLGLLLFRLPLFLLLLLGLLLLFLLLLGLLLLFLLLVLGLLLFRLRIFLLLVFLLLVFIIAVSKGLALLLLFLFLLCLLFVFNLLLRCTVEEVLESSFLNQVENSLILDKVERVQVKAQGAGEESRVLRDHRDLVSQRLDINFGDVLPVDLDGTAFELDDAGESQEEC